MKECATSAFMGAPNESTNRTNLLSALNFFSRTSRGNALLLPVTRQKMSSQSTGVSRSYPMTRSAS